MQTMIVVGDKVRPVLGEFKGQEGIVVDVYEKPTARVRVRFTDNSLETYNFSEVEVTHKKFNFRRFVSEL